MRKKTKTLIISITALAILSGLLVALLLNPQQIEGEEIVETSVELINQDSNSLQSMSVENTNSSFTLVKDDETWLMDSTDYVVDQANATELASGLSALTATNTVTDAPTDEELELFGFSDPRSTVKLSYLGGDNYTVLVGAEAAVSGQIYIMIDGDSSVYLASESTFESAIGYDTYFLSKTIVYEVLEDGTAAQPDSIELTYPDGTTVSLDKLDVAYSDGNYNTFSYSYTKDSDGLLNSMAFTEYLAGLTNLVATDIIAANVSDEELANAGLDNPTHKAVYKTGDTAHTLEIGNLIDGYYMVRYNGTDIIYAMAESSVPWVSATQFDFNAYNVQAPLIEELGSITVQTPDETITFQLDVENIADGGIVTYEDTELNWQSAKNFYRNNNSFIGDGATDGRELGESLLKVTMTYADSGETVTYEYYEYDLRLAAV